MIDWETIFLSLYKEKGVEVAAKEASLAVKLYEERNKTRFMVKFKYNKKKHFPYGIYPIPEKPEVTLPNIGFDTEEKAREFIYKRAFATNCLVSDYIIERMIDE